MSYSHYHIDNVLVLCVFFVGSTEQLSVHETCQEEEADSGRLQQSSEMEQCGGDAIV